MPKCVSKKGKGKYLRYSTANTSKVNKTNCAVRLEKLLEKRKEWRVKKLKGKNRNQISGTTDKLFYKWNVIVGGR